MERSFLTMDPEDRDGWTQQVVIKEFTNIDKLEVAEIMLQAARAQTTEIIYARWLDDVE